MTSYDGKGKVTMGIGIFPINKAPLMALLFQKITTNNPVQQLA